MSNKNNGIPVEAVQSVELSEEDLESVSGGMTFRTQQSVSYKPFHAGSQSTPPSQPSFPQASVPQYDTRADLERTRNTPRACIEQLQQSDGSSREETMAVLGQIKTEIGTFSANTIFPGSPLSGQSSTPSLSPDLARQIAKMRQ